MERDARRRRIETLDPAIDHREITRLFYLDFQSVLLLQAVTGNLMTFAVPRMSRILAATGRFTEHPRKRFIDTTLLVSAVLDHGLGPGPGRDAARRVNQMHRRYDIHPDDFTAVGCDVPLMSLEIADRFGWRPVTDAERESLRLHYSAEARAFGSHRPLPPTLAGMRDFWETYLDEQTAHEPQNELLTRAFLDYLPTLAPRPLRPLLNPVLTAQVDPRILRACGLPLPSRARRRLSTAALRLLGRRDPLPDPQPGSIGPLERQIRTLYPYGWTVADLG
ncbi:oxygenase MpaB family protein [Actinoplanes sp. G11-F43]|uniref:oxygenase MpaB family protein n=1 Tax=Actinoplanes sp. G11-F43 TaxID=3424130 RepID=UPI003D33861A